VLVECRWPGEASLYRISLQKTQDGPAKLVERAGSNQLPESDPNVPSSHASLLLLESAPQACSNSALIAAR